MTTIRDYLRDLVNEAISFGEDDERSNSTEDWVEDKIEEFIDLINERLIR